MTHRTITDHITNPANDRLTITVTDEPGAGGANHEYAVFLRDMPPAIIPGSSADDHRAVQNDMRASHQIRFQNGPIPEKGVNGITQEVLLAIVIDRLRSFQTGPYACRENALALTKCEEALHWLHHRTLARMRRGVEGTHAK